MPTVENHLIDRLPRIDRLRVRGLCEPVQLTMTQLLSSPGTAARHVYFPLHSFISLVAQAGEQPGLEVGMVGREGMLGAHLALGVGTSPIHALVQGPGAAWRIEAAAFQRELSRNPALQRGLQRYVYVLMAQLAGAALCLRFHQIGPRLARWLLMSHDRAHADSFHLTHEFLASMLGVRRAGISTAAGLLQRKGLIEYRRGDIAVRDRKGLEAAACSCYASDSKVYEDLLGSPRG